MEEGKNDNSPTSLVSGFSSLFPDEGTSLTSTVASALSITISGVDFFVDEGDLDRGAKKIQCCTRYGWGFSTRHSHEMGYGEVAR